MRRGRHLLQLLMRLTLLIIILDIPFTREGALHRHRIALRALLRRVVHPVGVAGEDVGLAVLGLPSY